MIEFVLTYEFFVLELESLATILSARIVIYQPQYFPRLHYFARILNSDIYAIADNLQYVRRHAYPACHGTGPKTGPSYQAHTPIKTSGGEFLLTVPVCHSGQKNFQALNAAPIDYTRNWTDDHLQTLKQNYSKAPYFKNVFPSLEQLLAARHNTLADLTIESTLWGLGVLFEINTEGRSRMSLADVQNALPFSPYRLRHIELLSQTPVRLADKAAGRDANDWLVDVCTFFKASEYYFGGTGAAAYMDFKKFGEANIRLIEQKWACGEYPQQHSKLAFVKNASILDLLMNASPAEARDILFTPAQ